MRIGIVCWPTYGGSGVVAADLAHALAERGHGVHLLSYEIPARLASFHPNLQVHPVDVTAYPLHRYPPYTLALAARVAEVARAQRLDIVNVHYAVPHGVSALLARAILPPSRRFALVTTCHGTDVSLAGGDPGFAPLIQWALRGSDAVTAVSGWLASETRRLFRVRAPKVLPNFVDLGRFHPGGKHAGGIRVAHCSNFRAVKRVRDVVGAFARVARRLPAVLDLVGDGPEAALARSEAVRLGVAGRVHFHGSQTEVEEVLRRASVYILASESESFGLSALEAMACGVPVVAPRVGGIPEVVEDGVSGLLCTPGDTAALGASLRRLCADEDLRHRMGEAARARATALFGRERGVDRYERLYREVAAATMGLGQERPGRRRSRGRTTARR